MNTQFAIGAHSLGLLAGSPGLPLSSETLARSARANPVHVRRVLGQLGRVGLVSSRSGPHGGWQLAADPRAITLADVWSAVHGDAPVLGLHAANPDCEVGGRVHHALTEIDRQAAEAVRVSLEQTTISEFAERVDAAAFVSVGAARRPA